jgi:hypothetical protein
VFAAPVSAADGSDSVGALLACSDGSFFDLTHNVSLLVKGGPPVSSLVFSAALSGVPPKSTAGLLYGAGAGDPNVYQYACTLGASGPGCTATAVATLPWSDTQVLTAFTVASNATGGVSASVWVSGASGTAVFQLPVAAAAAAAGPPWLVLPGLGANASSYSVTLDLVALGNTSALTLLDASSGAVVAWDWVTEVAQGWGAPIDGPVTALAYSPDGTLYIGNDVCLNIRFTNGTYSRIDGPAGTCVPCLLRTPSCWNRPLDPLTLAPAAHTHTHTHTHTLAPPPPHPDAGLPAANITSLAIDTRTLVETPPRNPLTPRVWIGTATGAILFDPTVDPADDVNAAGPALYYGAVRRQQLMEAEERARQAAAGASAAAATGSDAAPLLLPHSQRWRFFLGPRYLPVSTADTLSTPVLTRGLACVGDSTFLLSGSAGVGALTAELWTLAQKASLMETLQVRRDSRTLF